jgi:leucyl-tRNA synthetase
MEYNHNEIDKKWQQIWAENGTYHAPNTSDQPKFYVLDMFPYPSGAGLHVGHPLGYIASDIYGRYKKQKGFNVLHPMGYDAFGLPAEQYAIQTGQHPEKTTAINTARYREQLDNIGFGLDWSREFKTTDPSYYKWTQWIFIQLFDAWYDNNSGKSRPINTLIQYLSTHGTSGLKAAETVALEFSAEQWNAMSDEDQSEVLLNYRLAYRSESNVNWCPALGTVLANDEVKDGLSERGGHPVIQKKMMQWSMRITAFADRLLEGLEGIDWSNALKETQRNWIGKSVGAAIFFDIQDHPEQIEVFSTRPDTLFGATFVTLAPEHELVSKVTTAERSEAVAAYKEKAASRSERDRMADTKTISGCFTGAYALHPITGAHVPIWIGDYVLASYGTGAVMAVPAHDSRDYAFAKHFDLPIVEVVEGGDITVESYDAKSGKMVNSGFLNGMDCMDAKGK